MSTSIDLSFVKSFEAEVHASYQRMGSKLKSTVRSKNNVKGASTTFQKVGTGIASVKAKHGLVPVMNLEHTPVTCTLYDYYAGDWVDSLDEFKIGHDERATIANAGAYALGRKTDELIITELNSVASSQIVGDGTEPLSKSLILSAFAKLNMADVPDDGQRFGLVGSNEWNHLLNIKEFADSAYVGEDYPWLKGSESRKWLGINWIMHTGLPTLDGKRSCFIYHKTAVGHASGQDIKTDISWHGDHAAYFINNMMSQGAALIDSEGVIKLLVDEDAALS